MKTFAYTIILVIAIISATRLFVVFGSTLSSPSRLVNERVQQARTAENAFSDGNYKEVLFILQSEIRGVSIEEMSAIQEDSYLMIGRVLTLSGNLENGLDHFKLVTATDDLKHERPKLYFSSLCGIAHIWIRLGKFEAAGQFLNRCYDFFRALPDEHPTNYRNVFHLKGLLLHEQGDLDQALKYYNAALSNWHSSDFLSAVNRAATLNNIGNIYWKKGQYEMALAFHERSLSLKRKVLTQFHPDIATSYNNLGVLLEEIGDHERALNFHNNALHIRLNAFGSHIFTAHSYHNLASTYHALKDDKRALELVGRAMNMKRIVVGERHFDYVNSVSLAATINASLGRLSVSDSLFNTSTLYCNYSDSYLCSFLDIYYARYLIDHRADESAMLEAQKIISDVIIRVGNDHPLIAKTFNQIAESFRSKGEKDLAMTFARRAIVSNAGLRLTQLYDLSMIDFRSINRDVLLNSLSIISTILSGSVNNTPSTGQVEILLSILRVNQFALLTIERSLSSSIIDVFHSRSSGIANEFVVSSISVLIKLFRFTGDDQYVKQSLELADYSNNWMLQNQLGEFRAFEMAGATEAEISDLRRSMHASLELQRIIRAKRSSDASSELARDSLFRVNELRAAQKSILAFKYPLYSDYRPRWSRYTANNMREYLDRYNHNLIEYYTISDSLFAFVVTENSYHFVALDRTDAIRDLADSLRHAITTRRTPKYLDASFGLYERLFQPLQHLFTSSRLIIVPNRVVEQISFESLISSDSLEYNMTFVDAKLDFLIKNYEFKYGYSISMILDSEKYRSVTFSSDILAFAPVFDKSVTFSQEVTEFLNTTLGERAPDPPRLAKLMGSAREVKNISKIMKRKNGWFASWTSKEELCPKVVYGRFRQRVVLM